MPRKAKFTFVLKVDAHLVNTKYGFDLVSNIGRQCKTGWTSALQQLEPYIKEHGVLERSLEEKDFKLENNLNKIYRHQDLERFEDYQDDIELWRMYEHDLYYIENDPNNDNNRMNKAMIFIGAKVKDLEGEIRSEKWRNF